MEFLEPWDTGVSLVSFECPVMHLLTVNWVFNISCFHTEFVIHEDMENYAIQQLFETIPIMHPVDLLADLVWLSKSPKWKDETWGIFSKL
jgi:hypothetical protein